MAVVLRDVVEIGQAGGLPHLREHANLVTPELVAARREDDERQPDQQHRTGRYRGRGRNFRE
jgi:hypothetical protein